MNAQGIVQQVKAAYSSIANEFDATRNRPWPEFTAFLKEIKKYSIGIKRLATLGVLDVGCGNGRLAHFFAFQQGEIKAFSYTGIDNNPELIRIAKKKYPKARFRRADITQRLPFPPRSFDSVWCIAVLHHLPTKTSRLNALKEMNRMLKKEGMLMLTVWNLLPQKKYKKYLDPKTHDGEIPWGAEKKFTRFYHAFTRTELAALLKKAGFRRIKKITSKNNIAVMAYV